MSRFPRSGLFCLLYLLVLLKYKRRVLPKSQVTLHQHALNITIVQVSGNGCTLSYHPTLWLWELHRFCSRRFPVSDRQNWVYWGLLIKRSLLMEAFSSIISNSITMRTDREEICIITYVPSLVRTSSRLAMKGSPDSRVCTGCLLTRHGNCLSLLFLPIAPIN